MRVRIIGKREDLPEDIVEKMDNLEKATANNTGLQFSVAINYGGRDEITRAVRQIASDCMAGKLSLDAVTEDTVSSYLDTKELPRARHTIWLIRGILWRYPCSCHRKHRHDKNHV